MIVAGGCTGAIGDDQVDSEPVPSGPVASNPGKSEPPEGRGTSPPEETVVFEQACVDRINEERAALGHLPVERWISREGCARHQLGLASYGALEVDVGGLCGETYGGSASGPGLAADEVLDSLVLPSTAFYEKNVLAACVLLIDHEGTPWVRVMLR